MPVSKDFPGLENLEKNSRTFKDRQEPCTTTTTKITSGINPIIPYLVGNDGGSRDRKVRSPRGMGLERDPSAGPGTKILEILHANLCTFVLFGIICLFLGGGHSRPSIFIGWGDGQSTPSPPESIVRIKVNPRLQEMIRRTNRI